MKPHPRIRKTVKWGGAVVCVVLAGVWIVTGWWGITWVDPRGYMTALDEGCIQVKSGAAVKSILADEYAMQSSKLGAAREREAVMGRFTASLDEEVRARLRHEREQAELDLAAAQERLRFSHHPRRWHIGFEWSENPAVLIVFVPLWLIALGAMGSTAAAWRLDTFARRRAQAGYCPKCNYDRRGLPAANLCPECGAAPAPSPQASP